MVAANRLQYAVQAVAPEVALRPTSVKVYGYRWVVLAAFMSINVTCQILWICFSPVMGPAAKYYGVTDGAIGWLGMVFMVAYIPLALPAAWVIDTVGIRKGVGFGALLLGGFGLLRGCFGRSYTVTLLLTIGIAASQPFLLGAFAKLAARWFAFKERATVVGLCAVAAFLGIVLGAGLSPVLVTAYGFATMQLIYGVVTAASSVLFLLLIREHPPTPASEAGQEERALMFDGLKLILRRRDFYLLTIALFVGGGVFNGISIWVESIVRPRGLTTTQAGTLTALMMVGGIVGAVVLPLVSDRWRRRKAVLLLSSACAVPPLVGLTFAHGFVPLLVSFFLVGFFITGLAPVAYQYGAEITHPAPEGTSNGLYALAGQISVVFIYGMGWVNTTFHSFVPSLLASTALMAVTVVLLAIIRESPRMLEARRPARVGS
jgi:MFS family permease